MTSPQIAALADAFERCRDLDAPLNERLDAYSIAVRKLIPPYADAVDRLVARLSGMAFGSNSRIRSKRADHRHLPLDEIGRHRRQRIITIRYPAVFDRDILTLDIAHLGKTAAECGIEMHGNGLAQAAEISDYRHCFLLRARRERPCRGATDKSNQVASSHALPSGR